jgi:hypothetical protein
MLQKNMPLEIIQEITELSSEKISELQKQLGH